MTYFNVLHTNSLRGTEKNHLTNSMGESPSGTAAQLVGKAVFFHPHTTLYSSIYLYIKMFDRILRYTEVSLNKYFISCYILILSNVLHGSLILMTEHKFVVF